MPHWKDILCFLAILLIWGVVGHFDYEDAVALEKASQNEVLLPCPEPSFGHLDRPSIRWNDAHPRRALPKASTPLYAADERL
jgi:hypothetical protein